MALMSLSVKRHLGEEFPVVPPSPLQSPVYCPSPIRLLNGLHPSTLTENQSKKRRKQEHPLLATELRFGGEGNSESSAEDVEKFQIGESRVETGVVGHLSSRVDRDRVEDIEEILRSSKLKDHLDGRGRGQDREGAVEKKDIETTPGREAKLTNMENSLVSVSNVPLMFLSQVATDVTGLVSSSSLSSSPLKSQLDQLKQEEFVTESHVPSDGELPSGDPSADGAAEVCPDCKKVFKRKIYLQRHIAREHWSLAKIFKCEKCAYETKHQSNLLVHRRTHTGERPYHCGACGQRYTQGHLLKAHIRSRHGADMRFYNMDKRTDGMRCRRLIGAKFPDGGGKEDKIRFLLQAAEAARHRPAPSSSRPVFGAMMPPSINQYMNVLSCLPNGLRPVLWPSLSGGFPGNSGGFPSSPLPNGMPSHAALLSSLATPLSLGKMSSGDLSSKASGSLLSSMLALPSTAASLQAIKSEGFTDERVALKTPCVSPERSTRQNSFAAPVELPMMPEDLTTSRRTAAPPETVASVEMSSSYQSKDSEIDLTVHGFGSYPPSTSTSGGSVDPLSVADLSSQGTSRDQDSSKSLSGNDQKLPDNPVRAVPNHNGKALQNLGSVETSSHKPDVENVATSWSNATPNARSEPATEPCLLNHMSVDTNNPYTSQSHFESAQWHHLSTSHLQPSYSIVKDIGKNPSSPAKSVVEEPAGEPIVDAGCGAMIPNGHSKCPASNAASCKEACCPYLKKLKDLRRNVYRMLCVFTPYLGVANINDYEADSIDEFLHEVIYSKLDETE